MSIKKSIENIITINKNGFKITKEQLIELIANNHLDLMDEGLFCPDVNTFLEFSKKYENAEILGTYINNDLRITGIILKGTVSLDILKDFLIFRHADEFIVGENKLEAYYME
jgi:hypothetical protein